MSEQKKVESTNGSNAKKPEKKAEKKPGFFARTGHTISKWFRDFRSECKKIVWPTRKQVINNTLVVIAVAVVVCILVYVMDVSFGFVRDTIVKLV
ncbi:MAG: preprotein translocase subunit SecE [Clostridia bacterium]|nr:preprotein translocase subunit SecE [Clostridia bacterium]